MTLLDPKIEKSFTARKFQILTPTPKLTSNFETHKNVGYNLFLFLIGVSKFDVQKCPSIFFILLRPLEHVYTYLNIYLKIVIKFLWVSKFDVKLGVGVKIFKFTAGRWLFYFRFQKCHFFQMILKRILYVKLGVGVKKFNFLRGVGGKKIEFWWWVSSFSGGVGGIKFEFWWGVLIFISSWISINI